ncbi:MAG: asparagine synthase (glutamine-hydrolyzing), partial [Planctomycetota bacterium]
MCGIAGAQGEFDIDIPACLSSLSHRGPDAEGTFKDKNTLLVHTRLSILDLSEAGNQPMSNEDETVWVVHNGEIYNAPLLRIELESKGHTFKSRSDTEVLLHLFEEEGDTMVSRLRGMFSFS